MKNKDYLRKEFEKDYPHLSLYQIDTLILNNMSKTNIQTKPVSVYRKRKKINYYENKEYYQKLNYKFRSNNLEKCILYQIKSSAKKRNLDFNLTIEDIVIPEKCPLLEIPITRFVGKGKLGSNPSIDRIDNHKGYVKGNIRIISNRANTMKLDASNQELLNFAKNIQSYVGL